METNYCKSNLMFAVSFFFSKFFQGTIFMYENNNGDLA